MPKKLNLDKSTVLDAPIMQSTSYQLEPEAKVPDSMTVTKLPSAQTRFLFAPRQARTRNENDMDVSDDGFCNGLLVNGESNLSVEMVFMGEPNNLGAQLDAIFDQLQTEVEMRFGSAKPKSTGEPLYTTRHKLLTGIPFHKPGSFHARFLIMNYQESRTQDCTRGVLLRRASSKLSSL